MASKSAVVRDQRTEMSRMYWSLVEFMAGSSEREAVESVHRELQRRGLSRGARLSRWMFREGRRYGDPKRK